MYSLPTHLSPLAKDIIPRMLEVHPIKRITVPEIRRHGWFQHKLPPYLRRPPDLEDGQERIVDQEVVDEVLKLPLYKGFRHAFQQPTSPGPSTARDLIVRAAMLEDGQESSAPKVLRDLRCAYELIPDHKHTLFRVRELALTIKETYAGTPPTFSRTATTSSPGGRHSHDYLSDISRDSSRSNASCTPISVRAKDSQRQFMERTGEALWHQQGSGGIDSACSNREPLVYRMEAPPPSSRGSQDRNPVVQTSLSIPGNTTIILQHQHQTRPRRWYLGIQSRKEPAHIMSEVYKALLALGCEWLPLSPYRLKCKWAPSASAPSQEYNPKTTVGMGAGSPIVREPRGVSSSSEEAGIGSDAGSKLPSMVISAGEEGEAVIFPILSTPSYYVHKDQSFLVQGPAEYLLA
jgi:5'-AMP-activated protein kinase, catalytic alpha subunit